MGGYRCLERGWVSGEGVGLVCLFWVRVDGRKVLECLSIWVSMHELRRSASCPVVGRGQQGGTRVIKAMWTFKASSLQKKNWELRSKVKKKREDENKMKYRLWTGKIGIFQRPNLHIHLYRLNRSLLGGWDGLYHSTAVFSPRFHSLGSATRNELGSFTRTIMGLCVFQTVTMVTSLLPQETWRKFVNITGMPNKNPDSKEGRNQRYIHDSASSVEYDLNYFVLFSSMVHLVWHRPDTSETYKNFL